MKESKFVLGGGFANKAEDGGKSFYAEVIKDVPLDSDILIVPFAVTNNVDEEIEKTRKRLLDFVGHNSLTFTTATLKDFISQIKDTELIWITGGDPEKLINEIGSLVSSDLFAGKKVVGVSAGAYLLSTYYLSVDQFGGISFRNGTGILPIKTITHFGSQFYEHKFPGIFNWEAVLEKFKSFSPKTEELVLKEGDFAVF